MLKPIMLIAAISLALGSLPAFAQKKTCEEFCRTGPCKTQGMGTVNSCMSNCTQKCAIKRSGGK
jgi:hypothetical protein